MNITLFVDTVELSTPLLLEDNKDEYCTSNITKIVLLISESNYVPYVFNYFYTTYSLKIGP